MVLDDVYGLINIEFAGDKNYADKLTYVDRKIIYNKFLAIRNILRNISEAEKHAKINDLENYWIECAKKIGTLVPMEEDTIGNKNGNYFTHIKYPWHEKSDSFSHSNTRQPLHTDGSYESNAPNVTFFFCHKKPQSW